MQLQSSNTFGFPERPHPSVGTPPCLTSWGLDEKSPLEPSGAGAGEGGAGTTWSVTGFNRQLLGMMPEEVLSWESVAICRPGLSSLGVTCRRDPHTPHPRTGNMWESEPPLLMGESGRKLSPRCSRHSAANPILRCLVNRGQVAFSGPRLDPWEPASESPCASPTPSHSHTWLVGSPG